MNVLERFYNWQLDTGFIPQSRPRTVNLRLTEWLGLSPAYSLFFGAMLWIFPILAEALASLVNAPKWVEQQATSFFHGFHFYLSLLPLAVVAGFLLTLPQIWAWNRRAERLNREADVPQVSSITDMGIWPPPPTVSASADALPRI